MAKLGEVCLLKAGKFVSANDISPEYNKGLYPCFGGNGIRGYVADYTHDGEFPLIGRQGALCGNVNLASGKFHATEHAVVVQPKIEMNVHWLYYALNAMNLGQYATGAAQPGLAVSKLETLSIEIPNISEQNKIAQTLYKVEQLVNFRKQQLAKLDELVKARFVEMFGDFKSNSKGWSIVKFDDFAKIDGNMTTDYKKYADYPHIGIDSIEKGTGALKGYRTVKEDGVVSGKYIFTPQHIIYSKIRPNLNKVALPDFEGLCSADAYPILPNPKNCNRIFLALAMRSDYFLDYILQFSARTNLPKVNRKEIAGFSMPLPPLSLQNDFATFVERVNQKKQTIQQSLEKLELMKKALMQEYFG